MKKAFKTSLMVMIPVILVAPACKKNKDKGTDVTVLKTEILKDISVNVCTDSYVDMLDKANALQSTVTALTTTTNDANLTAARTAWKNMRVTWEQSEAWLFGPVEADLIDPRIDTWPVDFTQLDQILNSSAVLTEAYVDNLDDALKGFHPIEYLLWGVNGNKTATSFTAREKEYLTSLTQNLVKLTTSVKNTWSNGYNVQLSTAGNGSTEFATQQDAFIQLVDAMSDICGEVADSKLKEPFDSADPSKEESPFAKNSIVDFTNNIKGVMAMYQGKFIVDGKGIEDLVRLKNLSLDTEIKSKYTAAISALGAISVPFGQAITAEPTKIQNAMDKIAEFEEVLDGKLKPFLQQQVQ
ncbi:hypothetical protein FW774_11745 [Pedobacter sp. BS3]|uniref:imelysin family protein n=1 Tax=Pedobacter sp. BS3 TaxID=2567937 RepID=UPI0011EFD1E0|nr:imelysin family protein [Pedobacter sp. BS3]TZF84104.1 hypothetical protein FW774_11745 [Pedobacter sp. BS3]